MSVSVDQIIFVVIVCNLLINGVTSYIALNFNWYPFFHIKSFTEQVYLIIRYDTLFNVYIMLSFIS